MKANQRYAQEARSGLDGALDLINGLRLKSAPKLEAGAPVPASRFNRSLLLTDGLSEIWRDDDVWVGPEVFDLGPVHARHLNMMVDNPEFVAALWAVDSVTAKETRGLIRKPMRRMYRVSQVNVRPDRTGGTVQNFYGLTDNGEFVNIDNIDPNRFRVLPERTREHWLAARVSAGFGLYLRYAWTVEVRAVGSNFTLKIPTTPEGAQKLLALRDIEPGMARRRALRHWVREHHRRRTAEDAERGVRVRAHLRGVTPFKWEDLEGVVRPSEFDLENVLRP